MEMHNPDFPENMNPDELVALLDALCESGSQHINLNVGEETKVQTVNSTDCSGRNGACAIPTLGSAPEEDDDAW